MMNMYANNRNSWFEGEKLSSEDLMKWRLWRTDVLMPIIEKMEQTIVQNAHLIEGQTLPDSFQALLSHVAAYNAVIKEWAVVISADQKNGTDNINEWKHTRDGWFPAVPHISYDNFPDALGKDAQECLEQLKIKQAALIAATQRTSEVEVGQRASQ